MHLNISRVRHLFFIVVCLLFLASCTSLADVELPRFTPQPTIGRLPSVTPAPPVTNTVPPTSTPAATNTPTPPTATVNVGANVRAGPGTRFAIVGSLAEQSKVILISMTGNWYEVRTTDGSTTGWMIADVLDVSEEQAPIPTATPNE